MMQFEPTPERVCNGRFAPRARRPQPLTGETYCCGGVDRQARLLEVVSHLRNHREAREYLRYFSKLDTPRFAVILLESDLPASSQQTLASHLSVLQRYGR